MATPPHDRDQRTDSIGREILLGIVALLLVFAMVEATIRLAYGMRDALVEVVPVHHIVGADWGPVPPWRERTRMLEPHPTLVWRGKPHFRQVYVDLFAPVETDAQRRATLRRFLPARGNDFGGAPVWTMALNSEGFRERELPSDKPEATFRIVCLGDSWTAGSNVEGRDTFPSRLEALLAGKYPDGSFEVLNLGVFGYASYNGLQLAPRAMALRPDVVVIGFAMNEAAMAGYRPPGADERSRSPLEVLAALGRGIATLVEDHFELYRLLRYWALLINWEPRTVGDHLRARPEEFDWYASMDELEGEDWVQAALLDYRRHVEEMLALARSAGADGVLLYPEFWTGGPFLRTLRGIARREEVPLVDASRIIGAATGRIRQEIGERFGLLPAGARAGEYPERVEVVFRVHQGSVEVPEALFLAGTHPSLGDAVPNRVALSDDGRGADERAGDGVWTYAALVEPGADLHYVYTNSGREGEWEGLDLPVLRRLRVPENARGRRLLAPIETFGELELHADPWHTDAQGNDLIAGALVEAIERTEGFQDYLGRLSAARGRQDGAR
jgi:lysophospholipase L1-like esterase